jgi:hypothetical protein
MSHTASNISTAPVLSVEAAPVPRTTVRAAPAAKHCLPHHIAIVPEPAAANLTEAWLSSLSATIEGCRADGVKTLSILVSDRSKSPANEQLQQRLVVWLNEHVAGLARKGVLLQAMDLSISPTTFASAALVDKPPVAHTVNLAIGYDGRAEIAAAARAMARECVTDPDELRKHLPSAQLPPVDLLIHAGGQTRLSGFLLWQSAYAELLFTPARWTSFDRANFTQALEDYAQRKRTFGGLA